MQNQLPDKNPRQRTLTARLDRAARDMNAFLLVLAIGLATLDLTCLWAFKMRDALPGMTRSSASAAAGISKPAHVKPTPSGNPAAAAGSG